ncbi:MAG: PTH1 family peptidyl-tRNA hydrolase, partial [Glaciecola sp.]
EMAEIPLGDQRAVLCIAQSFMNTSGGPVQSAAAWYDIPVEQVIVLHDELDLDAGMLRCKRGGGHGGHNGLKDIDRALGSRDYLRVRLGIGKPPGRQPGADWVLRRPPPREREALDVTLAEAGDCVETLIAHGLAEAQNRYNAGRAGS